MYKWVVIAHWVLSLFMCQIVDTYLLGWVQHGHGMRSCTATHVAVVTRFSPKGKMLARAWSPPRLINTYPQFGT
jgi:hypothetical protein